LNRGRFPLDELIGSLNPAKEIDHRPKRVGTEKARKGVDKILRRHLPAVMELDPLAQGEGPGATITGSFPELGDGGNRIEVRIELDQALGDLRDNGAAINIAHKSRIKRSRIVGQRTTVSAPEPCVRFRLPQSFCQAEGAAHQYVKANP